MTTQLQTTFALLREHGACTEGYKELAKTLGGVSHYGADKPIDLRTILDSNGLDDTLWCLRATLLGQDEAARRIGSLFAADCAKHVLHIYERRYPEDKRVAECIEGVYRYWRGEIDFVDLQTLRAAANAAYAAAAAYANAAAYAAAAYAAAAYAAYAAAAAYANASERTWQRARFAEYLEGKV